MFLFKILVMQYANVGGGGSFYLWQKAQTTPSLLNGGATLRMCPYSGVAIQDCCKYNVATYYFTHALNQL